MDSNNEQCSFNKNGSCLFYDAIISTIKFSIAQIEKGDIINAIDNLKDILKRY